MLMLCWFYCIPLAKGIFFASAPMVLVLALFILKRGIRQSRPGLRKTSFLMMFVALLKMTTVDIYFLRMDVLCVFNGCHDGGLYRNVQLAGGTLLVLGSFLLFNVYRVFAHDRRQKTRTPEQVHLSFWANAGLMLVLLLLFWLAAPWAGYLTVGHIPDFFLRLPWQYLVEIDVVVLLIGFWKLEDCLWIYNPEEKKKHRYKMDIWTAKDTLWVSVVLLVIGLGLSYASNDVLSMAMPQNSKQLHLNFDNIDLEHIGPGFQPPPQVVPSTQ